MTAANEPSPQPKRRRFTFSLRTLLILMVVASLALAFVAHPLYQWRQQDLAIRQIKGAHPDANIQNFNESQWVRSVDIYRPKDGTLLRSGCFAKMLKLKHLTVQGDSLESEDLIGICGCAKLNSLVVSGKNIDDRAVVSLQSLTSLEFLSFPSTP